MRGRRQLEAVTPMLPNEALSLVGWWQLVLVCGRLAKVLIMNEKNDQSNKFLPIWMWLIVLLQILLVFAFSAGTAMSPAEFIPDVSELNYVTQLYITRNVTVVSG